MDKDERRKAVRDERADAEERKPSAEKNFAECALLTWELYI